jgi:2'-5' RNA ligase
MDGMMLPIATFGNVTPPDARRVTAALTSAALDWPRLSLMFSGATVADFRGDRTVWVRIGGDVAALTEVARSVPQCVERLGFFVDRRRFHPLLPIVTVSDRASEDEVDALVRALDGLHGRAWTMNAVTLFTTVFVGSHSESEALESIPLGPGSSE